MLFGRVTYDSFAGAWPGREAAGGEDAEFAKKLGDMRKIVVSHQPLEFMWRNSEQTARQSRRRSSRTQSRPLHPEGRRQRVRLRGPATAGRRPARRTAPLRPSRAGRLRAAALPGWCPRAAASPALLAAIRNRSDLSRLRAGPEPADRQRRASQGEPPAGVTARRWPTPCPMRSRCSGWSRPVAGRPWPKAGQVLHRRKPGLGAGPVEGRCPERSPIVAGGSDE